MLVFGPKAQVPCRIFPAQHWCHCVIWVCSRQRCSTRLPLPPLPRPRPRPSASPPNPAQPRPPPPARAFSKAGGIASRLCSSSSSSPPVHSSRPRRRALFFPLLAKTRARARVRTRTHTHARAHAHAGRGRWAAASASASAPPASPPTRFAGEPGRKRRVLFAARRARLVNRPEPSLPWRQRGGEPVRSAAAAVPLRRESARHTFDLVSPVFRLFSSQKLKTTTCYSKCAGASQTGNDWK